MKFCIKQLDRGEYAGRYVAVTVPAGDRISSHPYEDEAECRWHAERAGYIFDKTDQE